MKKRATTVSHEEVMTKLFRRRPGLALGYLNDAWDTAFKEDDPAFALMALSDVVKALGTTRVAKETGLQRESIHRMLSQRGNPEWKSMFRVLKALGLRPRFERVKPAAAA